METFRWYKLQIAAVTTKDLPEDCQGFNTVDILIRNVDKSDDESLNARKVDKTFDYIVDLRSK